MAPPLDPLDQPIPLVANPAPDEALKPEPRFVVGQVVEDPAHRIQKISACEWNNRHDAWCYRLSRGHDVLESTLRPHTMTLADVPDETLLAITRGKPMRVVNVPVSSRGEPYGDGDGNDYNKRGQSVRVESLGDLSPDGCLARLSDGETDVWIWNLEPAKETDHA